MVCPECGGSWSAKEIIKVNIRGFERVDIVYDVLCPRCKTMIGRMFWGKMLPNRPDESDEEQPSAATTATVRAVHHAAQEEADDGYYCPHCGNTLEGDARPCCPRREERRTHERRQGERRQSVQAWFGVERRRQDRREGDRRHGDRRAGAQQAAETMNRAEVVRAFSPLPETAADKRTEDRRKENRPVLYDRRTGRDRRRKSERAEVDRKI